MIRLIDNRPAYRHAVLAISLLLVLPGAPITRAADVPVELKYVKKDTRDATRAATLKNHPSPSPALSAHLAYRLEVDFPATEEGRYYPMLTIPAPPGEVIEAGGIEVMDDGRLAVCTRHGDVWMIEHALETPPYRAKFTRFASGLHEPLGIAKRNGWLYVVQRCEVSRLKDVDGDGRADLFETVSDEWGITGDYHEYAFGSKFDRDGYLWVTLCLTGSFTSNTVFRGWTLRISEDGEMIPTVSGIRSPGGIGMNCEGEMFATDNQGIWNGTSSLKHCLPGAFIGVPVGNIWYDKTALGPRPADPRSGSRMHIEAQRIPELMPPVVMIPHGKLGQSASGIVCDNSGGKFGPFAGQLFVSDQTFSNITRVVLEKVNGRYQGACFLFRQGFASGNISMTMAPDGSMLVGGTDRGWGARGGQRFGLQRLVWSGKTPFEVLEMYARHDGFDLTFTKPVDRDATGKIESYKLGTYTYIYQKEYGSPEVDRTTPTIKRVTVAADGRSARLVVDGLQEGHVHELHMDGVRAADGAPLLHAVGYYTMNQIPSP